MDYYATNMEYQDGLFYLYREDADYGAPLYSLVIKDLEGNLVEKYYPMPKLPSIHECVFCKRENDILFAQDMNDSVFVCQVENYHLYIISIIRIEAWHRRIGWISSMTFAAP